MSNNETNKEQQREFLLALTIAPTDRDILAARGRGYEKLKGNKTFRAIVKKHATQYSDPRTNRQRKAQLVKHIRDELANDGMRFLNKVEDSWVEMGEEEVRGKIAHSLRDCKVRSTTSDASTAYMKALIRYNSVVKRCISESRPLPLDEVSKVCVAARTDGMQIDAKTSADSISSDEVDSPSPSPSNPNPEKTMLFSTEMCSESRPLLLDEVSKVCDAASTDGVQVDLMRGADSISSDEVDPPSPSPFNPNPETTMSISAETYSELPLVEAILPCDDLADEILDEFVTSTDENGDYTLVPMKNTSSTSRAA